jgi:signal transduction histidine kinase
MAGLPAPRKLLKWRAPARGDGNPGDRRTDGDPGERHGTVVALIRSHSTATILILTVLVSGAVTLAFALLPELHLDYEWPSVRIAVETSGSLIALFATFLVFGRLRRRTYLNELLLASALAVLAISNLLFVTVPTVASWAPDDLTVWGAPLARSLGALLFILAAFIPRHELRRRGQAIALTGVAVITAIGLAVIFVHSFAERWAPRYAATLTPEAVARPGLRAHPVLFTFELLVALLYALAAVGFLNRAKRLGDEFFAWLAVAAVLAVVSHVNYSLFPASYSQSVLYTGDMFRFAFYVALLLGCLREIWSYWTALSAAAVLEDRRRMARDLHDGLAQELAYISRNLDFVAGEVNRETVETMGRLRPAVERAQAELRSAISALAPPRHRDAETALAEATSEVAERFRIELKLDLVPGIQLSPTRTEALIRIACEAVANAARHSGATSVTVRLERDGSLVRLRVLDRGCGFDTAATPGSGFGLVGMKERARSVGGELRIRSAPGRGSEVDVAV